jgi:hypothetical protein
MSIGFIASLSGPALKRYPKTPILLVQALKITHHAHSRTYTKLTYENSEFAGKEIDADGNERLTLLNK